MIRVITMFLTATFILTGCSKSIDYIQGEILEIQANRFYVDCSDEVNKLKNKSASTVRRGCYVKFTSHTIFQDINGNILTSNDFLPGSEIKAILSKPLNAKQLKRNAPISLGAKDVVRIKAAKPIDPYHVNREEVVKVTVYRGDEIVLEINESKQLDELLSILHGALAFSGIAPDDWPYTIAIQTNDQNEIKLEVTGNGYVFVDPLSRQRYVLDKERFYDFVDKYRTEISL